MIIQLKGIMNEQSSGDHLCYEKHFQWLIHGKFSMTTILMLRNFSLCSDECARFLSGSKLYFYETAVG